MEPARGRLARRGPLVYPLAVRAAARAGG